MRLCCEALIFEDCFGLLEVCSISAVLVHSFEGGWVCYLEGVKARGRSELERSPGVRGVRWEGRVVLEG